MLTGDISLSGGTAVIAGFDIQTHLRKVCMLRSVDCDNYDEHYEELNTHVFVLLCNQGTCVHEKYIKSTRTHLFSCPNYLMVHVNTWSNPFR